MLSRGKPSHKKPEPNDASDKPGARTRREMTGTKQPVLRMSKLMDALQKLHQKSSSVTGIDGVLNTKPLCQTPHATDLEVRMRVLLYCKRHMWIEFL